MQLAIDVRKDDSLEAPNRLLRLLVDMLKLEMSYFRQVDPLYPS